MSKQDTNMTRTPQDLERKYDLKNLLKVTKNIELNKEMLTKVENELKEFVVKTTNDIDALKNQVDGNITTWFFSGVPTLSNKPAQDWITENDKNNHLGDLYYDQDTGNSYRFIFTDEEYQWLRLEDTEISKVLAIANKAQDTADSKRRIFVEQPITPYDVGDLWIKDMELYRCQTTKTESETYEENDWIIATKYTDDTIANQVGKNLTILSGTVTEIKENVDVLSNTMTNTTELLDEQGLKIGDLEIKTSTTSQTVDDITRTVSVISNNLNNNYTNNEQLEQKLEEQKSILATEMTTQYQQNMNSFTFDVINKINESGVTTLKNTMVSIDENGINTAKNDEDVVSLLDNKGVYVSDGKKKDDDSNVVMKVDRTGGYLKTIEVKSTIKEQDIIQKELIDDETFGKCQGWYWIGSDN